VLEGGEVGRGMFGAQAAFIVSKDHVQDPVEAVLDTPYRMPLII